MCYWKQWRWARTKIRHLLDLVGHIAEGCYPTRREQPELLAHGQNSGGPTGHVQRLAQAQGLLSIKDLWCKKAQGYGPAKG